MTDPPNAPTPEVQPEHSPSLRNAVHALAFIVFAVPIGALADPRNKVAHGVEYVVGVMLLVTVLNIVLLPRLAAGKRIARPGAGWVRGEWLYPLALAICFAIYPPFAAFGAWAAMAGGDAAAAFVGRAVPRPRLPWNRKKSWAGSLAFVAAALPFCFFALYWCPSQQFLKTTNWPEIPYVWTLAVLAAVSGAILESFESPGDDNLRVPLSVGAVLWLSAMFLSWATRGLPADTPVQPELFLQALAVNAVLGGAVLLLRFADLPGTGLGVAIGVIVCFFAHWQGYLLFLLFVGLGSGLSRVGLQTKEALGVAEPRGGKRGIANVAANLAVPALCCLAYPESGGNAAFLMAFAGALAAALADTASSEIGALSSKPPVLITTVRPSTHGTNGAVTLLGYVAAALACVLIAGVAWSSGFYALLYKADATPGFSALASVMIIAGGMFGTTVDSVLGATVEDRLPGVGKGVVNFFCTLTGAAVAGALATLLT